MKRLVSIITVVLLSGGVAWGQGEVVSFYGSSDTSGYTIVAPEDNPGFVLTDVVIQNFGNGVAPWSLHQDAETKLALRFANTSEAISVSKHFNSGIPIAAGTTLTIHFDGPNIYLGTVTLSGYIPCPDPCLAATVPTVGEWGTFIMLLLLMIGGTRLFARRASHEAREATS